MPFLTQGKTNWKYIIIFAAVAIALSVFILWYVQDNVNTMSWQSVSTQMQTSVKQIKGIPANLSYENAVKLYINKRIQFSLDCQATPFAMVFKPGTKIMLDNRSALARNVSLDGVIYPLNAYGYTFVTLATNAALPHTMTVSCGKEKNDASILLEK